MSCQYDREFVFSIIIVCYLFFEETELPFFVIAETCTFSMLAFRGLFLYRRGRGGEGNKWDLVINFLELHFF